MMQKTKMLVVVSCSLVVMQAMTGCNFEKEKGQGDITQEELGFEIQVPGEMPVSICIEDGAVIDEDGLLEHFYGETRENLMAGGYIKEEWYQDTLVTFHCNKDDIQLSYMYTSGFENVGDRNSFSLYDMREAAGIAYAQVLGLFDSQDEISNRFKSLFPETELDWYSRNEAITACAPLAKACGYEEAEVKVYAMTEEILNRLADDWYNKTHYFYLNAPSSDYDVIEWDNKKKGDEWTKPYEAYFVVYQTVMNGLILDSTNYYLCCVYAPAYGRVVYAQGDQPLRLVKTLETVPLAIQKDSLLQAIEAYQEEGNRSIAITNISMVYAPKYAKMGEYLEIRTIDPCWRIDYEVSESLKYSTSFAQDDWTIMVNAVDGSIVKYGGLE